MSPEQWREVRAQFERLCDLPGDQQTAGLAEADCSTIVKDKVKAMLIAEQSDRMGQQLAEQAPQMVRQIASVDRQGQTIGPYTVRELLGRGGMGEIYRADRTDNRFEQQVAVKFVVLPTAESAVRFERERRLLARLEHPSIARLLDGGVADDGAPYLIMEYIAGSPIHRYFDDHRFSIERRLQTFLEVIDAVSAAHRQLIIHRDIKPENVLIDAVGRPRLIDFGIGKSLGATAIEDVQTLTEQQLMTPRFAAPEQMTGGAVGTHTDSFQLGILLDGLLCGVPARELDGTSIEQLLEACLAPIAPAHERLLAATSSERIAANRQTTPDRLARQLRGDLRLILQKACATDPQLRYRNVDDMADDIKAWLDHQPVRARPPSRSYLIGKFVRRHRLAVAFSSLGLIALLSLSIVSVMQARKAQAEAARSRAVQQLLTDVFERADPFGSGGGEITLAAALTEALPAIERRVVNDAELDYSIHTTLAGIFNSLGMTPQQEQAYRSALAAAERAGSKRETRAVSAMAGIGDALVRERPTEAVHFLTRHLPDTPTAASVDAWLTAKYHLAYALIRTDQQEAARQQIALMQSAVDRFDVRRPRSQASLHQLLAQQSRWDGNTEAELAHLRSNIEHTRRDGISITYLTSLHNLAMALGRSGYYEESDSLFSEAIGHWQRIAPDHPSHGTQLTNYGGLLFRMGRADDAISSVITGLDLLSGSASGYQLYRGHVDLANYSFATGAMDTSFSAILTAIDLGSDIYGESEPQTLRRVVALARRTGFIGDTQLTGRLLDYALERTPDFSAVPYRYDILRALIDLNRTEDAVSLFRGVEPDPGPDELEIILRLACYQADEEEVRSTVATITEAIAPEGYSQQRALMNAALASVALQSNNREIARDAFQRAIATYRNSDNAFIKVLDRWQFLSALHALGARINESLPPDLTAEHDSLSKLRDTSLSSFHQRYADQAWALLGEKEPLDQGRGAGPEIALCLIRDTNQRTNE